MNKIKSIIKFWWIIYVYSVPLTKILCVFVDDCDESNTVSDAGGASTSAIMSFCCQELLR